MFPERRPIAAKTSSDHLCCCVYFIQPCCLFFALPRDFLFIFRDSRCPAKAPAMLEVAGQPCESRVCWFYMVNFYSDRVLIEWFFAFVDRSRLYFSTPLRAQLATIKVMVAPLSLPPSLLHTVLLGLVLSLAVHGGRASVYDQFWCWVVRAPHARVWRFFRVLSFCFVVRGAHTMRTVPKHIFHIIGALRRSLRAGVFCCSS